MAGFSFSSRGRQREHATELPATLFYLGHLAPDFRNVSVVLPGN
jgi:hypothetical protein